MTIRVVILDKIGIIPIPSWAKNNFKDMSFNFFKFLPGFTFTVKCLKKYFIEFSSSDRKQMLGKNILSYSLQWQWSINRLIQVALSKWASLYVLAKTQMTDDRWQLISNFLNVIFPINAHIQRISNTLIYISYIAGYFLKIKNTQF